MKLLIFAASHRVDSYNRRLAKLATEYVTSKKIEVDFADYSEFDMPIYNDANVKTYGLPEEAFRWVNRAKNVDGIIISVPEYNWSYPGSLKNIIDWTSCIIPNPIAKKTILLMSATLGKRGNADCINHLKPPLSYLKFNIFPDMFSLPRCDTAFDATGNLVETKQQETFTALLDDYILFTQKLSV